VKTKEAPVKLILKDLLDMVKGVQQPTRGLFLRYYLMKMMKDILPDKDTAFEGEGGDVNDAIDFILQNMSEMNRLGSVSNTFLVANLTLSENRSAMNSV